MLEWESSTLCAVLKLGDPYTWCSIFSSVSEVRTNRAWSLIGLWIVLFQITSGAALQINYGCEYALEGIVSHTRAMRLACYHLQSGMPNAYRLIPQSYSTESFNKMAIPCKNALNFVATPLTTSRKHFRPCVAIWFRIIGVNPVIPRFWNVVLRHPLYTRNIIFPVFKIFTRVARLAYSPC